MLLELHQILALLAVAITVIAVPGPSVLFVIMICNVIKLVCVSRALVSDSAWALFAGAARGWLCRSPRRMEIIGGGAGIVMIDLGANLAIAGRRD